MKLICGKAPEWLLNALCEHGFDVYEYGCSNRLPEPVAHHIDLMAVKAKDKLFAAKDFKATNYTDNYCVIGQELSDKYPFDVPLNVAFVGDYLICNPKTAAKEILEYADKKGLKILRTAQGYTKCSTLVVDDRSIITEDESIYESAKDKLSVLKIKKGYVELPGYDYGFIGGASFADDRYVYFFGNIHKHPQYDEIEEFIHRTGKEVVVLSEEHKLLDIGGVIMVDSQEFEELHEEHLSTEEIFDGAILHVIKDTVKLPNGKEASREVIRHIGAVCIIPVTDDGEVVVERQFRYPIDKVITEIPAGKLDSANEVILEAAKRELKEETGIEADKWTDIGVFYPAAAYCDERITMFLAQGLHFGERQLDEDEFLNIKKVPLTELVEAVMAGDITDAKTQIGILKVARILGV